MGSALRTRLQAMMSYVVVAVIIAGGVVTCVLGFLSKSGENTLALETYKLVLSFMLVGILGAALKAGIDASISRQREESRRYDEWSRQHAEFIRAFTEIYSEFYSLRKLYHSARDKGNTLYTEGASEYNALVRECLRAAVTLEGRYGALKVAIIQHCALPTGDYGYKDVGELLGLIETATDGRAKLRYAMDLLGELYDDWRDAFEAAREIEEPIQLWSTYEQILAFLSASAFKAKA